MKKILRKYKLIIAVFVLYAVFFIFRRDIFFGAVNMTWKFLIEMIQVLPPVLVISALITVWVPSKIIEKGLGDKAGMKGKLLSLLIGSVSAGPIYAAFPAVLVLFKKGASISNMVIILSSWAVVKIPMILVETSFLGAKFALTRAVLTVPTIILMGFLVERFVKRENINEVFENTGETVKDILIRLPNLNCGGCGYADCKAFAEAVFKQEKALEHCVIFRNKTEKKVVVDVR